MLSFQRSVCICVALCISSVGRSVGFREVHSFSSLERGSTFASHYRLVDVLKRAPLGVRELPYGLKDRFGKSSQQIGSGTFGEVWKALDTTTGEYVVIKLFVGTVQGNQQPLTWSLATYDNLLYSFLRDAEKECQLAIDMQLFRDVSAADREAASHIMKCKEDHVKRPVSSTGHEVGRDDIVYHIFEFVGDDCLDTWMARALKEDNVTQYIDRSLRIFTQLVRVLDYFGSHQKRWVHHDLKPANIVVKKRADGHDHMTVIDLGSATEASVTASTQSLVATLEYSPFEGWNLDDLGEGRWRTRGYDFNHVSSFDMYSAGVILHELLTGELLLYQMVSAVVTENELHSMASFLDRCYKFPKSSEDMCQRASVYYAAGRPGGCAQRFLHNFTDETTTTVDDAYVNVSTEFHQRAKKTSWYTTFKRIIAYYPSERATPPEVLASDLLQPFLSAERLAISADGFTIPHHLARPVLTLSEQSQKALLNE